MMAERKQAQHPAQGTSRTSTGASVTRRNPFTVTVGDRMGEELEGLEAHLDGVSFRSPRPILGGEVIHLILHHTILVDAEVVGCARLTTQEGGYWVRARFVETSRELNSLICAELNRLIDKAAAADAPQADAKPAESAASRKA